MQDLPAYETARRQAGALAGGHCWVEELVDGSPLRFRVAGSGLIEFADHDGPLGGDVPPRYRNAVRTVRERLDREAVRNAVDDPTTVTFVGVATHYRRVEYDWATLPGFLGTAVHHADRDRFLPPDVTRQAFERVGLDPIRIVDQEVRCADVDPEAYSLPDSAWRDGPVAGLVFTNKAGGRAVLRRSNTDADPRRTEGVDGFDSLETLLAAVVTDDWLRAVADTLAAESGTVTADVVAERSVERIGRETRALRSTGVDAAELRQAVAERAGRLPVVRS